MSKLSSNTELRKIEADVIEFLKHSQLFIGDRASKAEILSYFITRKQLTQSKLKKLTGLSRGTISQELQDLIQRKIIKEKKNNDGKVKIYVMESIIVGFINYYLYSIKEYATYKEDFLRMNEELEKQKEVLQKFEQFHEISKIIHLFLAAFPLVEEIIDLLKEKREQLKKTRLK